MGEFQRSPDTSCDARLVDLVEQRAAEYFPTAIPRLRIAALLIIRRTLAGRCIEEVIDPLAHACAREAGDLLEETPPRVFAAYLALEVAAAREPRLFGSAYRSYRDMLLRLVLGAARDSGIRANVADTTVTGRWVARRDPRMRARLVGNSLWIDLPNGRAMVFDADLGMVEGFDA